MFQHAVRLSLAFSGVHTPAEKRRQRGLIDMNVSPEQDNSIVHHSGDRSARLVCSERGCALGANIGSRRYGVGQ